MSAKILIVNDSLVVRKMIVRAFRAAGFEGHAFVEASNTAEVLERLAEGSVKLAICDSYLPGSTGIDLLRQIRTTPAYGSLPALFFTVGLNQSQIDRALAAGYQGYLKDLTVEEVQYKVEDILY
ncbi:response regulator [Pseudomonas sp. zfem002]|uniref:response regulator n=1 Tax=Pseudomonas sp. zfem002 TaxID=3078197 RepID=UPI002929535D|nr:response regulator [Pseudomonas sp. zfem002]MDU9392528.1 response regulator [Pseudomonas sp. zfem002]